MKKSVLRIGSAGFAIAMGLCATHALAQDTPATAGDGEILVTAQKRSQELIEVPQSVTVVWARPSRISMPIASRTT